MICLKKGIAGTVESNDCMMTVSPSDTLIIEIESIVKDLFGDQIEAVIRKTLKERGIQTVHVKCLDKGAIDYTIKARLLTALDRLNQK